MRVVASVRVDTPSQLAAMLAGMQVAGTLDMERAKLPRLYDSGIVYRRERPMQEHWKLPSQTFADGYGDCEDLAVYRAAELALSGENARVVLLRAKPRLWHVAVQRANGTIEDPSKILGMKGPA